jgi:hypothetical protein
LPVDPVLGAMLALPLVVGAAWIGLKRTKRRLHRDADPAD